MVLSFCGNLCPQQIRESVLASCCCSGVLQSVSLVPLGHPERMNTFGTAFAPAFGLDLPTPPLAQAGFPCDPPASPEYWGSRSAQPCLF